MLEFIFIYAFGLMGFAVFGFWNLAAFERSYEGTENKTQKWWIENRWFVVGSFILTTAFCILIAMGEQEFVMQFFTMIKITSN